MAYEGARDDILAFGRAILGLESIYLFLEKLQILQGNLKSYSRDFIKDITKNKLSDLYDDTADDKISLHE